MFYSLILGVVMPLRANRRHANSVAQLWRFYPDGGPIRGLGAAALACWRTSVTIGPRDMSCALAAPLRGAQAAPLAGALATPSAGATSFPGAQAAPFGCRAHDTAPR